MPRLMTVVELSNFLSVPVNTLYQWRSKQYGPRGTRVGRYVRYREEEVLAWLNSAATKE